MREADVSNGENPDGDQGALERPTEDDASDAHLTGHRQAAIDEENDPPG